MKKHIPTLAIAMAASILVACGGDTPTTGGGVTSSNVTLSGVINTGSTSTAASTDGGIKKLPTNAYGPTATGDLTGFKLYCVTFTDPPLSGTGELTENADGSYGYSVTLTDAAGLPIGCFLNDPANKPVSTVTFNVTDSTSLNSSSSGAALSGGTHEVTINYDPVTGTSTAAITTAVLDTTTPTTDPSTIASQISGSWKMGCDDPAPVGVAVGDPLSQAQYDALSPCQQSFNIDYQWDQATGIETMHWNGAAGGMPLYLNVVSGTQDGTAVNAMGVWPDKTTFDGCGSTEAMSQTALTAHNVSVTGQTGSTSTSAVGNFIGVHDALVTAGAYVVNVDPATGDATASGSLVDIKNALATTDTSLVYNSTFNDQWFTDANGVYDPTYDYCDTTTDALGNFAQNTVLGQQETQCYTQFLQNQYHQWP
ncbi:MAG: hypothetical protein OEX12_10445, partial [Gammaproteobacteria bacterium]|nr:hypothetical protein [Gammaproteobacteria bacterium]